MVRNTISLSHVAVSFSCSLSPSLSLFLLPPTHCLPLSLRPPLSLIPLSLSLSLSDSHPSLCIPLSWL